MRMQHNLSITKSWFKVISQKSSFTFLHLIDLDTNIYASFTQFLKEGKIYI